MSESDIARVIRLLMGEYGDRPWHPDGRPLACLVQTILSQNTSDVNSARAFERLVAAIPTWEAVAGADEKEIAEWIRCGGLGDIKARRIRHVLAQTRRERGDLSLDFLGELPLSEAREWLTRLPGVGAKTASCVLLFSLGVPALPVDTHVHRVSRRLGLAPEKASVEQTCRLLEALVAREDVYRFHMLIIEHGRRVCQARRPRCPECALRRLCPSRGERPGATSVASDSAAAAGPRRKQGDTPAN